VRAFAPGLGLGERPLAITAIVLLTGLNVAGVRRGFGLQTALTALKVLALVALVGAGLWLGGGGGAAAGAPATNVSSGGLGGALLAALFTFGGWHVVTFPAAETVAPERTLPRALVGGILFVLALYLALNLAYLSVLSLPEIAGSSHVAADVGEALAGPGGRAAVAALAALSALAALAGMVLVGPRVWHALAAEGRAPRWLAALHPRHRTPHLALAAQGLWASLLVAFDSYRTLYGRALVVEWLFFALLGPAVIVLRRRGVARRFSAPLHPLVPIVFSAAACALVVDRLWRDPFGAGLGIALAAAGIPVFWALGRARRRAGEAGATIAGENP
jgi:APA family basic amino acid/polyamine antiporter